MEIVVSKIDWETDGYKADLPKKVIIPLEKLDIEDLQNDDEIEDEINNYLSNTYDFLVNRYLYEIRGE